MTGNLASDGLTADDLPGPPTDLFEWWLRALDAPLPPPGKPVLVLPRELAEADGLAEGDRFYGATVLYAESLPVGRPSLVVGV